MRKILLYIILFLSSIDGVRALPIEKEGMSIYSPALKKKSPTLSSCRKVMSIQIWNIPSCTCFME